MSNVESLVMRQNPQDALLFCQFCTHNWIDVIPYGFPLSRYPCENCNVKGRVVMGVYRREL